MSRFIEERCSRHILFQRCVLKNAEAFAAIRRYFEASAYGYTAPLRGGGRVLSARLKRIMVEQHPVESETLQL